MLTEIVPFEATGTAASPAQLVCQGPDNEDAHCTVATLPGARLLHTNTPLPLKEVMTGACACAATVAPSTRALRPILTAWNAILIVCSPVRRFVSSLRRLHSRDL